jgi:uncharacterized protein
MNNKVRFPCRFFIITFIWSWIVWTPLVLGSLKIIPFSAKLLSFLTLPVIMLGVFGPLAGAIVNINDPFGWRTGRIWLEGLCSPSS